MTIKLYKVNVRQSYRLDEQVIRWFISPPINTVYYKHEILEEIEAELPEGITFDNKSMTFSDKGHDCQMVNERNGSVSLVSSQRIIEWLK